MKPNELRGFRRKVLEMTQAQLAAEFEITTKTIGNYERGRQKIPILFELACEGLHTRRNMTAPLE